MSGIKIINLHEVNRDYTQFDKATRKDFLKTMRAIARGIAKNQKTILRKSVTANKKRTWKRTYKLGRSIKVKRGKAQKYSITLEIGPDNISYAKFVEDGGHPFGNVKLWFAGYNYVKNSAGKDTADTLERSLEADIQRNLKN